MRSLFWKFFITFWLTQAIVLALAILLANFGFGREHIKTVDQLRSYATNIAQEAADTYETKGAAELNRFLDSHFEATGARFWLFDKQANELSGNPYTTGVANAVRGITTAQPPPNAVVSMPVTGTTASYTFAGQLRPRRPPRPPTNVILRQLLLGFIVSGGICFLLAHSLARPIVQLREAAQELAIGNLGARAGGDVGKRKDEIGELGRDFDRMAGTIEGLVSSQKQLLRDISHDLRSPLQRIRMALELARRGDSSQVAQLDRIERETVRINSFIEQLLTLARLETNEATPSMEPLSFNEIVEHVVGDAKLEAERVGCALSLTALTTYSVKGNAEVLQSAVENVVRNAIHYGAAGKSVELGLHGEGNDVVLTVRDHGPGVREEALPRLFEAFYRVDSARSLTTGGSGLGLAIASKAVALHGGSISAHNATPSGLVVTIHIPLLRG
jgi:two-component system sensor histidine kinase CpxA